MSYNHCLINHTLNQFLSLIVIKSDNTMLFSMFKFVLSVGFVGEIHFGHGRSDLTFLLENGKKGKKFIKNETGDRDTKTKPDTRTGISRGGWAGAVMRWAGALGVLYIKGANKG